MSEKPDLGNRYRERWLEGEGPGDMEYGVGSVSGHSAVCEKSRSMRWAYRATRNPPPASTSSLEDEISNLRQIMEQAANESDSLTSDVVVEISRLLDDKINEYMKQLRKN